MALFHFSETKTDRNVAKFIAANTSAKIEGPLSIVTWAADPHVMIGGACVYWLYAIAAKPRHKALASDILVSMVMSAVLPHLIKRLVDQERPDRSEVHGRRRGIPISGHAMDAFPSGHSVHLGALASAISGFEPRWRAWAWTFSTLVAATRILILAHWVSDVVVGLALGCSIEHVLRPIASGMARRLR
jgi:membrane-associated phospholipid phosphatase